MPVDLPAPHSAAPTRRAAITAVAGLAAAARLGAALGDAPSEVDPAAIAALTVFGRAGSFGALPGAVPTVAVPGWGFGPGQAAYMSAVATDGTVFVATTPFTDDQSKLTGTDMELAVFEPSASRFTRLVIPSTTGRTALPLVRSGTAPGIGGGDIADVAVVPGPDGIDRAVFVSAMPYSGWDPRRDGLLPTVGQIRRSGADGAWRYDPGASRTADALAATLPAEAAAVAFPADGAGVPRTSRGPASLARLPRSGHLVVAQYFGSGATRQGALLVVDVSGHVRATFQYPPVGVLGLSVVVNPREVTADPSSAADDERFVVISDCHTTAGAVVPFPVQEFSYTASTGTIRPRSTAVRAASDDARMETACFGPDGTLYVARTRPDGQYAAQVAVYRKVGAERGLVSRAPASAGWATRTWGSTNPADALVPGTDRGGLVRSIVCDPVSGAVILSGLDGLVQVLRSSGPGRWAVTATVDLRLDRLRSPSRRYVGVRRGCVDPVRRLLWLPVNQLVLDGKVWPYPPFPLDQWIYRLDLDHLVA